MLLFFFYCLDLQESKECYPTASKVGESDQEKYQEIDKGNLLSTPSKKQKKNPKVFNIK